jgi:quercetin dioxygenase-like cupin family protein
MSSIQRPLAGPSMTFPLAEQIEELRREEPYARSGRAGRTLAKSGDFRVVLVAMADGNVVGTHQAHGPMTIHLLRGHLRYRVDGEEHALSEGEVLFFGPAAAHDITADADSALLLTLSQEGHAA